MKKSNAALPQRESRVTTGSRLEVRKKSDGSSASMIFGYAAKFAPVQSSDLGGFVEEIHPNAFDACLRSSPDVVGLWNHDVNHVLGRTTSGTVRLSTDKTGLLYEIDPPPTQFAKDLMVSIDRGDIHQSSFGFYCIDDSWREGPNGVYIRTVMKAELFDVSPVTFPAYPDATSGVRASLRNAPAALRRAKGIGDCEDDPDAVGCKEKKSAEDMEAICEDDPDAEGCDEYNKSKKRKKRDNGEIAIDCDCPCDECEAGDCDECSNTRCTRDECSNCPAQVRQAHRDLLIRRMRA
jgi:uncharacterized protein